MPFSALGLSVTLQGDLMHAVVFQQCDKGHEASLGIGVAGLWYEGALRISIGSRCVHHILLSAFWYANYLHRAAYFQVCHVYTA
jgi:hypothetical protein